MAKFTVDRSKWYRGQTDKESKLLRDDGTRCCIGFVGQQCGISDALLSGAATIWKTLWKAKESKLETNLGWPAWMTVSEPKIGQEEIEIILAYRANDDPTIDDATREAQLQAIFARNGDEIVFEN